MNIGLLRILHNRKWDFRPDLAQTYANALRNAIELQLDNDIEKQHGYFLSRKGYRKEGKTIGANFEDKLYVGNIHRIENHLYWNDEELAEDDEIINVVVVDGPVTRDGGGCSYGSKDWRDQVMYANTIPQVVGHLFIVNTPGGEAECRNDYEMMFADCREKGKPTVALVDGGCYSSGVNLTCRCDRVVVMNPRDGYGCIGTMAAFWAVAHDTVDQDGCRYVELVGKDCPEKNAWWRDAAKGEYEKLQAELDEDTEDFHRTVRENRPLVTDDMLSGKVFEAQEVMPALVDEIGDMERAIECVFQLADKTLTPAREATVVPDDDSDDDAAKGTEPEGDEPEDKAQEAAVVRQHTEQEIITPKNDSTMTEEEKKAAEAAEQPAATQEENQAPSNSPEGGEQGNEAPAASKESPEEEQPAAGEEAPGQEEEPAAAGQPSEQAVEDAAAEIDRITETLHNAEQMVADRDAEIAQLKETLATLSGIAEERDAAVRERNDISASLEKAGLDYAEQGKALTAAETKIAEHVAAIEKLKKQVADLKAEVKELSGQPTPMVDAASGIPADNGTGDAPKHEDRITSDMTYEEIRAKMKKGRK